LGHDDPPHDDLPDDDLLTTISCGGTVKTSSLAGILAAGLVNLGDTAWLAWDGGVSCNLCVGAYWNRGVINALNDSNLDTAIATERWLGAQVTKVLTTCGNKGTSQSPLYKASGFSRRQLVL
jgi:hypothetical protein